MKLGIVKGHVVATVKHSIYEGKRLLLVDPCSPEGEVAGKAIIAIDEVQAGPGDVVLFVDEGNSARTVLQNPEAPVRAVLVAIVDRIDREIA